MSKKMWALARSVINAKKCVDSIMYIDANYAELCRLGINDIIENKRKDFFIYLCDVLDKSFDNKQELCEKDDIVNSLYYDRDKNAAHIDLNYQAKEFSLLNDMVDEMKKQIIHVRTICNHKLPENLTLDFVPYDKGLYRFVNRISAEEENAALKEKYNFRELVHGTGNYMSFDELDDTDVVYLMDQYIGDEMTLLIEDGLIPYETIQILQDKIIDENIKKNKNEWSSVNYNKVKIWEMLKNHGFINEYGMFYMDDLEDFDKWETYLSIINDAKSME